MAGRQIAKRVGGDLTLPKWRRDSGCPVHRGDGYRRVDGDEKPAVKAEEGAATAKEGHEPAKRPRKPLEDAEEKEAEGTPEASHSASDRRKSDSCLFQTARLVDILTHHLCLWVLVRLEGARAEALGRAAPLPPR